MRVHLEPVVLTARFYEEGKSYEEKDEFNGVATVQIENNTAYISGAMGSVPRHSKALFGALKKLGVREVTWVRADGKKRTRIIDKEETSDPS